MGYHALSMTRVITDVLRCRGVVGRGTYLATGLACLACKTLIEWTVPGVGFGGAWSPAEYLAPGSSLALAMGDPQRRAYYLTMLLIALPFIAVGIALTSMRLRSIGVSPGW